MERKFERKKKSTLMTPDPYHIPGYCGYCPQFKYQIGETFGRTTCSLLTDPRVASSEQAVLSSYVPRPPAKFDARKTVIEPRSFDLGDQKLSDPMVPGYTGFIPKGEHYFGKRYADTCLSAIADFQTDQNLHRKKTQDLRTIADLQSGKTVPREGLSEDTQLITKHRTPLKPVAEKPKEYYNIREEQHSLSPYIMPNDHPHKYRMSGYTGFVPRSRKFMGMGYPVFTNKALCEFTDECTRIKRLEGQPVKILRPDIKLVDTKPIYIKQKGLVPHYTGHVPGEKFRFGSTFGESTKFATLGKAY